MADHDQGEAAYHPKDAVGETLYSTGIFAVGGLFISAIQNTLAKENVGVFGVFTRSGKSIGIMAATAAAYTFTSISAANLREKDDALNSAMGGFATGSVLGLAARSLPAVVGYGSASAVVLSTLDYTGGSLAGPQRDNRADEVARKEEMRQNRRRPIEEVVGQLGEGRGIYGPGYQERRAERIKNAYGIDVPVSPQSSA